MANVGEYSIDGAYADFYCRVFSRKNQGEGDTIHSCHFVRPKVYFLIVPDVLYIDMPKMTPIFEAGDTFFFSAHHSVVSIPRC